MTGLFDNLTWPACAHFIALQVSSLTLFLIIIIIVLILGTVAMRSAVRKIQSYSLDPEVVAEVERTKGNASASERVNRLLKYALEMERKASLHQEVARFFGTVPDDREERRAFQKANRRTWARE